MDQASSERTFLPERFREYLRLMARIGLDRKLQRRLDPSDLVQETLLEAHRSMHQFRGEGVEQQAAWLRQILAHNLANAARDHGRARRDVALEESLEQAMAGSSIRLAGWAEERQPSPSSVAVRGEEVLRLSDAIATLEADEAEVLFRRYWQGAPLDEIGRLLGISRFAASRLLRRAHARLRVKLKESE